MIHATLYGCTPPTFVKNDFGDIWTITTLCMIKFIPFKEILKKKIWKKLITWSKNPTFCDQKFQNFKLVILLDLVDLSLVVDIFCSLLSKNCNYDNNCNRAQTKRKVYVSDSVGDIPSWSYDWKVDDVSRTWVISSESWWYAPEVLNTIVTIMHKLYWNGVGVHVGFKNQG